MAMRGESVFLDTNILLSASDRDRSAFAACREVLSRSSEEGYHLYIGPQIVREYLGVATRPATVNGLELSVHDAVHNITQFRRRTVMVGETEQSTETLLSLIAEHAISGKQIHDANIVALMTDHGISRLITLNTDDFKAFAGIDLYTPDSFLLAV